MAQLDQIINALIKHKADALALAQGQKPALLLGGTTRPVTKTPLDGAQVSRLVAEIAPEDQQSTVASGGEADFVYTCGGTTVQVEVRRGPRVVIRPASGTAQPQTVAAQPQAQVAAAPAPAAAPAAPATASGDLSMDTLFRTLVERDGSDLHLSSDCRPMIRVHGEMQELSDMPKLDATAAGRLLLAIAPERNRKEFEQTGDTDFAYEIEGLCRFRCNLFMDRKGPGGVSTASSPGPVAPASDESPAMPKGSSASVIIEESMAWWSEHR